MAKKKVRIVLIVLTAVLLFVVALFFIMRSFFKRPYGEIVEESGTDSALVYAVMKAESDFKESAVSGAGAVGLMQLMPSTAKFICEREKIPFDATLLTSGAYNVTLGCKYLAYLLNKFAVMQTAVAAYNAGEGTVERWLLDRSLSRDGQTLTSIPYGETREYVKKVSSYYKIYKLLYESA